VDSDFAAGPEDSDISLGPAPCCFACARGMRRNG
jgi:hypothetical protein